MGRCLRPRWIVSRAQHHPRLLAAPQSRDRWAILTPGASSAGSERIEDSQRGVRPCLHPGECSSSKLGAGWSLPRPLSTPDNLGRSHPFFPPAPTFSLFDSAFSPSISLDPRECLETRVQRVLLPRASPLPAPPCTLPTRRARGETQPGTSGFPGALPEPGLHARSRRCPGTWRGGEQRGL